jgi:hypothetical protein
VSRIPCEARDGLMRAWLEILRERHPAVAGCWPSQKEENPHQRPSAVPTVNQLTR